MNTDSPAATEFLTSHTTGVLATVDSTGMPHARTVYYVSDTAHCIYFLTLANTRKVTDLEGNPAVAFVVSDESMPATLQIEGTVTDITETATDDEHTKALLNVLFEKGDRFAPVTHLDVGVIRIYKITPSWMRLGQFKGNQGSDEVFSDIQT